MSDEPVYVSEVKIERVAGPVRHAYLPAREEPVLFGVHSAIAEHYGLAPADVEPLPTTLDYVVASAAG